jgi:phosphate transport system permease protein
MAGQALLLFLTCSSVLAVLFIFYFIARDAIPFFTTQGFREFFTSIAWYPSATPPSFGAAAIFYGSLIVTIGAAAVAVPLGIAAAVCLSDILPFGLRQACKPVIEILAAIPSVAYGFFALAVFAPLLQNRGGTVLAILWWLIASPLVALMVFVLSDLASTRLAKPYRTTGRLGVFLLLAIVAGWILFAVGRFFAGLQIDSGTNALNVAVILGVMALPTVVSVSEDALQAVGRDLREGSYALGATRAETLLRVVIPAASSGIAAAVILGVMRAIGETMVVWMASGNSARIPSPWYNLLDPVRTLTATIAGDMGEADQMTGSSRYHVLFAMALCLLVISFVLNILSEWAVTRTRKKLRGE